MKLEEAEKKLEKAKINQGDWFCPLINDRCNTECYCYVEPKIVEYDKDKYTFNREFCSNGMFEERPMLQL